MRSLPLACARPLRAGFHATRRPGPGSIPVVHEFATSPGGYPHRVRSRSTNGGRDGPSGYDPGVTPLLLAAVGVVALSVAGGLLRTFGGRYRVGRLIASTPKVTVAEANELARAGRHAYVRVDGRIDALDEFEGPEHQPLVYRRVRLEQRIGRRWEPFEDQRNVVPFTINEGLDAIAVDIDRLDPGLVVVPRYSEGRAADLADRVPPGTPADRPVRAHIDQVSSVEHAIVLGYPVAVQERPDGATVELTSGDSRPLILSILEPAEAMRVIAADGRSRTRVAAALIAVAVASLFGAALWAAVGLVAPAVATLVPGADWLAGAVLAASPEATPAEGGDPRSNGQGPGLVGTPGLAILGVVAIAVVAIVVTTIYVRLTTPSGHAKASPAGKGRPPRR